jgi:hypothetical protein
MDAFRFIPLIFLLFLLGAGMRFSGLLKWIFEGQSKWALASLAAHLMAGFGLYGLYVKILPDPANGDVLKYLNDAGFLSAHLPNAGWWKVLCGIGTLSQGQNHVLESISHWELSGSAAFLNEGRTLIRLHMVLWPVTKGFWVVHVCFFAVVSWLGSAWMAKAGERLLPKGSAAWMPWAIGATPSWLFWSSGMLKEALVAFGLGILTLTLTSDWKMVKKAIFLLAASVILVLSKVYLIPIALFASVGAFLVRVLNWRPIPAAALAFGFWMCFLLFPASVALDVKQHQFVNLARGGIFIERTHNGLIDTLRLESHQNQRLVIRNGLVLPKDSGIYATSWVHLKEFGPPFSITPKPHESWRLLSALKPAGSRFSVVEWKSGEAFHNLKSMGGWMLNALTRPWPGQCRGFLDWVNFAETWILLFALVWSLVFFKPSANSGAAVTAVCLVWCCGLAVLVGITTPVVGALVRYRAVAHPAIMLLFLRAWSAHQIKKKTVMAP